MTDSEMELEVTVLHGIVWEVSNMVDQYKYWVTAPVF